jgi:hypothetical protein
MKQLLYIILFAALGFAGCKKSVDFIADNTDLTGTGSYPISANPITDIATARTLTTSLTSATPRFLAGAALSMELQYFSESPIKEVNLFATVGAGARTQVFNKPYSASFSAIKRVDTLLVPYTVPAGTPASTGIKLEFQILNQNTLSLTRTVWLRVQ